MNTLSAQEELRYNRQIILGSIDFDGQEKLKNSHMLIVGLGGLGCAAAQYLTAAGIGNLTLLDFDTVSLSNLQRQILHTDERIHMEKVLSAKLSLEKLNPYVQINTINKALNQSQLLDLLPHIDVVLDCSDNLQTRNLLDQCCQATLTPLVSGAAIRFEGQVSVFTYQDNSPSYQQLSQLFANQELTCVEAGIIAPMVGIIGSIQALEAIKVRLNIGKNLTGRLLMIDGLTMSIRELKLPTHF